MSFSRFTDSRQLILLTLNEYALPRLFFFFTPDVLISSSVLLTAGLAAGQRARIFPLSGLASVKLPPGVPSLRNVQEAGTIRLREILTEGAAPPANNASGSKTQQHHWLSLAAREILGTVIIFVVWIGWLTVPRLVDLKYITSTQVIEFNFEGRRRKFRIQDISAKNAISSVSSPSDNLSRVFDALALSPPTQLWTVNWDATVSIVTDTTVPQEARVHKVSVRIDAVVPMTHHVSTGQHRGPLSQV